MTPTFRDLYAALPTIRYNIRSFNSMGLPALSAFFLSVCIVVSAAVTVYGWLAG